VKAVYLTKGALDIFDTMEYSSSFRKIINGLQSSMSKSDVPSSDRVIIGKDNLRGDDGVKLLKDVLGNTVNDEDYEAFIHIFQEKVNKSKPEMGYYKNLQVSKEDGPPLIKFSDDFWLMLDKLRPASNLVWDIYSLDSNPEIKNIMNITSVDISDKPWYFDIKTGTKPGKIKVAQFIKYFFKDKYTQDDIYKFTNQYNSVIGKVSNKSQYRGDIIKPREFKFEPSNIRDTFISLVTETYPMGHEKEVVPFITPGLTIDRHGNYYKVIGDNPDISFTCHLDTASRSKDKVGLIGYKKDGQDFIMTDGTSILGADDKAGVAICMYMIENNIPGVYWFFYGEERGGIGSGNVANDVESYPFMSNVKKMISFDRRNYYSIITAQMSSICCSNEFAQSLCEELNKSGLKLNLDPTGVFTDSANFMDIISECTNVSVGYFNEHTHDEIQNITYLENLAKACVAVDWSKLVVKRKVGFDDAIVRKYNTLMKDFKKLIFYNVDSVKGIDGKLLIDLEVNDDDLNHLYRDMMQLQELFAKYKIDPEIKFEEEHIKIELD
jgi:hypothetical protein